LGFEIVKESYAGSIREISIGKGNKAVTVGGETCYPFYQFEGDMPNKPKVAMEIWDMEPEDWPEAALAPFKDVISDPAKWAKKCVSDFGAEMIVLQLKSTDPNGNDASPDDAVATVKKVLGAIDVPLILWGCANAEKDEEVFKKVAEECQDATLTIGPVEDKNHKSIGAAAMGYGHTVISSSPIDVNLAKQVNILLENLGMPMDRIIVDPTTGGVGYGMEYSYSVMERLRMAAMTQGDDKLQFPLINNLGNEVWKCKEAKQTVEEAPTLGDPERRGILMEAVGAVTYLMAGSDILFMRHPEAIRMVKAFIDLCLDGGTAADVAGISKQLDDVNIDYASLAPKPDLKIEEEKKAAPKKAAPKKATPAKAAAKKAAPAKAAATAAPDSNCPLKPPPPQFDKRSGKAAAPAATATAGAAVAIDMEALKKEIRAVVQAELKAAGAEAKPKKEVPAKPKVDPEEEARDKAEAEAAAKREEEENELRLKRAQEREKHAAKRKKKKARKSAAREQGTQNEKIVDVLNRIHRRIPLY
jgi:acetyl-CoA decarbonylase/synthase complex subunit delta